MPDQLQSLLSQRPGSAPSITPPHRGMAFTLNIGLILFVLSLAASAGLFGYERWLNASRQGLIQDIQTKEATLKQDSLADLAGIANALRAARSLLAGHMFTSNAFQLLREATHARVYFTNFSFSSGSRKIDLAAIAPSYQAVADQITLLEMRPEVETVDFGGLSRNERGLVSFQLNITFRPSLLQFRNQ